MQTEFTCGIYTASFNECGGNKWFLKVNTHTLGIIEEDGNLIVFTDTPKYLSINDFAEITVLMNNIKQQYKQLQTT
jgi:hypothetical protein